MPATPTQQTNAAGCRFYVSPDRHQGNWLHPLEQPTSFPGWIDCTDLNDAEFETFMRGA